MVAEQQAAQCGRHREGDQQRCQRGDNVGDAEWAEEAPFQSLEEQERHADEHDHQRGKHHRLADLAAVLLIKQDHLVLRVLFLHLRLIFNHKL